MPVNQQANGGAFNLLGTFNLNGSSTITLSDQANGYVIADAIQLIALTTVPKMYFVHTDHLNTPRLIASDTGQAVWTWNNDDPYGNNAPNENPAGAGQFTCNLRLPGQYFDSETNIHYNYFRDYDPLTGRYVQSDPIGLVGGINTYAYVRNNPLTYFDPDGLEVRFICRALAGIAAFTGKQHCFVYITCPQEGWASTLSLYGGPGIWPRVAYKAANEGPDNPTAPSKFNQPVTPNQCFGDQCGYEKEVLKRFNSFPGGFVPYTPTGPNSNSFAKDLIGGTPPPGAPGPSLAPGINMPHPSFPR